MNLRFWSLLDLFWPYSIINLPILYRTKIILLYNVIIELCLTNKLFCVRFLSDILSVIFFVILILIRFHLFFDILQLNWIKFCSRNARTIVLTGYWPIITPQNIRQPLSVIPYIFGFLVSRSEHSRAWYQIKKTLFLLYEKLSFE